MVWLKPYIIVRNKQDGKIEILHQADTLKMARYWLQNLAQIHDAIFTTSCHSHYKGDGSPIYMCHLVEARKMEYNKEEWLNLVDLSSEQKKFEFQSMQTEIVEISNDISKTIRLEQVRSLLNINEGDLSILLSKVANNTNWQSFLTLENKNVYLVSLNPNSTSPLTISMNKHVGTNLQSTEEPSLKFVITPRTVL